MAWNFSTFQSRNLPENTFVSDEKVVISEKDDLFTFRPVAPVSSIQIIFFQGGLTDPKAYAPLCRKLAENGFTCHLIKMKWRLPQYDFQKINRLFDLKAGNYVIGGHSQGGKMAAQFVFEHPGLMKGLFLMGTSHPRDIDLSQQIIPCLKLYAENDGLASMEEVLENKPKLPEATQLVLIAGGNHSQFGYLGKLFLDDSADISLEEQQLETLHQLLTFFKTIKSGF
jgi:hypothetical protein